MARFSVKLVDGTLLVHNVLTPQLEFELANGHQIPDKAQGLRYLLGRIAFARKLGWS